MPQRMKGRTYGARPLHASSIRRCLRCVTLLSAFLSVSLPSFILLLLRLPFLSFLDIVLLWRKKVLSRIYDCVLRYALNVRRETRTGRWMIRMG